MINHLRLDLRLPRVHRLAEVLRALEIFCPTTPLCEFIRFHRAFVQCRFQTCAAHLRSFVQAIGGAATLYQLADEVRAGLAEGFTGL